MLVTLRRLRRSSLVWAGRSQGEHEIAAEWFERRQREVSTVKEVLEAKVNPDLTFEKVENEMRRQNYGVLSTISGDGRPHSAGVMYAVSARSRPFALYIVT